MAKQNEYEVNTDKSVQQLDKLEKKLSRVDSLFERAQRRGSALGKMNIAPTLALNDKLSDQLTRIENRLQGLNRTTISPSLHIADKATAEIAGVAAYLKTVTETKWIINFEAISWGKLFSGSFSDWLKGQNLMTSIKEQLSNTEVFQESGTLAGQQFFQSFLEAIDPEQIAEKFKELELNANVNINGGSDSGSDDIWSKTEDFFLDVAKGALSNLLSDGALKGASKFRKYRKKKREEKKLAKDNPASDSGNKKDKGRIERRKDIEHKQTPPSKPEKSWLSQTKDNFKKWTDKVLGKKENKNIEKIKTEKFSWKPVPDLKKGIDYKGDKFKPISSLSKDVQITKFLKGNALGIMMDAATIISADSGKSRSKAIGGSILSTVGAGAGGFLGSLFFPGGGTIAGSIIGANLGSDLGEFLGGTVHDLIYGKDSSSVSNIPNSLWIKNVEQSKLFQAVENRILASGGRGGAVATGILPTLISSTQPSPVGNIGIPGIGSSTRVPSVPFGFVPTPPTPITPTATMQKQPEVQKQILDPTIQVNLPVGAVQLTVNQPELNYDQIASVVGTKITSSVQLAWQNTKLR